MALPTFAFVSIFDWPAGWVREQKIEALSRCVGIDPADANLRVAKPAPLALIRLPERAAGAAVRSLRDMGVPAFAPTERQLNGLSRPIVAKRLSGDRGAAGPAFLVEPWRGHLVRLEMSEVFLIVRAAVVSRRSAAGDPTTQVRFDALTGTMYLDRVETPPRKLGLAEVIELHTSDGARFRIDGNKFNFDVLGNDRGHADSVNADLLADRLTQAAPRARIDMGFADFSPPPGAVRALDPGAPLARSRMPEFEFYSAWLHMLHRFALGV
jgi:hypothetical protein